MATRTASLAAPTIRYSPQGQVIAHCRMGSGSDGSLSTDIFPMIKVPHGAVIVDGYTRGNSHSGSFAYSVVVGTAASGTNLSGSLSNNGNALNRFTGVTLPHRVSVSDDAGGFTWVSVSVSGFASCTNTWSLDLVLEYHNGGSEV